MSKKKKKRNQAIKIRDKQRNKKAFVDPNIQAYLVANGYEGLAGSGRRVYDENVHPKLAYRLLSRLGLTYESLGDVFGVSRRTIEYWCLTYPKFKKAVKIGRDKFDVEVVENALLNRATGYEYDQIEKHVRRERNKMTGELEIIGDDKRSKNVFIPPDVAAAKLYLTNRNPDRWSEKREIKTINTETLRLEVIKKELQESPQRIASVLSVLKNSGVLDDTIQEAEIVQTAKNAD